MPICAKINEFTTCGIRRKIWITWNLPCLSHGDLFAWSRDGKVFVRLRAISAGIEAPAAPFRGVVHSVFARACNIDVGSGSLATLLTHKQQNLPCAVRFKAPARFDFFGHVRIGQKVSCDGDIIRFADIALEIDLRAAQCWHIDLGSLRCNLGQADAYGAWQVALSEVRASPRNHGLATMLAANGTAPAVERPEVMALARRGAARARWRR